MVHGTMKVATTKPFLNFREEKQLDPEHQLVPRCLIVISLIEDGLEQLIIYLQNLCEVR